MRIKKRRKIRKFVVNKKTNLILSDVGEVSLKNNEHLTINVLNKKHDICAMNWGLYATSSINSRLKREGFITALTKNSMNKLFIMIVDKKKRKQFSKYCKKEKIKVVEWLNKIK